MTSAFISMAPSRARRAARYAGESYHAFACSTVSNSSTTIRWGVQSPSSDVVAPPRARYRPPYLVTEGPDRLPYSSSREGSRICSSKIA